MRRTAALAAAMAVLATGACAGGDDGGSEATESLVLESCAPGRVALEVEVCRCAYRELADRFDAEEIARLDRQLRDDPDNVPAAVQEVVLACESAAVAPPPVKPTTTSTTTTTTDRSSSTSTTDREP